MNSTNLTDFEMLLEKAEGYTKATFELFRLQLIDKLSELLSSLAVQLVLIVAMSLFSLLLNIGLALWIGECFGQMYLGFLTMAGFYLLSFIFIYINRETWIKRPIDNFIINTLFLYYEKK